MTTAVEPDGAPRVAGLDILRGLAILGILFIAAGISGLVVGGLYVAQRVLKPSDGEGGATAVSSVPAPGRTAAMAESIHSRAFV